MSSVSPTYLNNESSWSSAIETAGRWLRMPCIRAVTRVFLLSRIVLIAVSTVVAVWLRTSPVSVWNQWDSSWYLGVAAHGYHWILPGHHASAFRAATLAFFPLYPFLIRILEAVRLPGELAGLVISNVAMFAALLYMYSLFQQKWGERMAERAILLVVIFPTAFFTFAPYTEAVFLLAAAGVFYHAGRGQFVRTGLWLAVAMLTRSTGIILLIPAFMLLRPVEVRKLLVALVPVGAGWTAYILYLLWQHIPLTYLLTAQLAWHRGLTVPWSGFVGSLLWLPHGISTAPQLAVENIGELVLTSGGLCVTAIAWRHLSPAIRAYCVGFWALVLCSPEWLDANYAPFSSVDRFVLALFPLAGWAAFRLHGKKLRLALTIFAVGFVATAATHISGGWIG